MPSRDFTSYRERRSRLASLAAFLRQVRSAVTEVGRGAKPLDMEEHYLRRFSRMLAYLVDQVGRRPTGCDAHLGPCVFHCDGLKERYLLEILRHSAGALGLADGRPPTLRRFLSSQQETLVGLLNGRHRPPPDRVVQLLDLLDTFFQQAPIVVMTPESIDDRAA